MLDKIKNRPLWATGLYIGIFVSWLLYDYLKAVCVLDVSNVTMHIVAFSSGVCAQAIWILSPRWKQ